MKNTINLVIISIWMAIATISCSKKEELVDKIPAKVDSYYPNSGKAGTLVTIEGQGFSGAITEFSATVAGGAAEVISATSTSVVLRVPKGDKSGGIVLKYGSNNFDVGTYTYQDLSVSKIFPTNGTGGTQLRIDGEGFGSTDKPAEVYVNSKKALVVSVTDKLIVAEIPEDAGYGAVEVRVDGKKSQGQNFTYQVVRSIKPLTGGAGTKVTLMGEGFEKVSSGNIVDFNGKIAVVLESSPEKIVVVAPAGVSTGPLSVNINEQKISGPKFTVVGKPEIGAVSPLSGPKGAEMTISGLLFSKELDENQVFINGKQVAISSSSENQLKLIIPGGTGSGKVRVVVNDQSVEGPQFKDQTLGIRSISPDNGLAGTSVTLLGTGFSTNAAENRVYFNGVLAPVTSASENKLVMEAPQGVATGEVKVIVGGQDALAPQPFRRAGVMTFVGGAGSTVFGNNLAGMAIDAQGNLYVADPENKQVKKVSPTGSVSILQVDGANAVFDYPTGIVVDTQNNIYVSDQRSNQIFKITAAGKRTIHAKGFSPGAMCLDLSGNLYVAVAGFAQGINKVNLAGGYTKVPGPSWVMAKPFVDSQGVLYYSDQNTSSNNGIEIVRPGVTRGERWVGGSDAGYQDGIGTNTYFNGIGGITAGLNNRLIVADNYNYAIREVNMSTREVTTLIKGTNGYVDGTLSTARFGLIKDIVVDKDGNIYLLDVGNKAIRKLFLK
ncbi:IPT/TIG domain-containing protein [Sphingobacterium multivorum]|uniref:IPT/TIG domain-containing protein n=1 Tax=Sphingobacterium multivorum TaxID=28454 RepID=UPI0031BB5583